MIVDPIAEAARKWDEHGWSHAAEGMAAVTSVMRAQQILQARVDHALKPLGLTFARYELLMLLHFSSRGSMPVKKASERLQVHPTSITNAVDRLEASRLVVRRAHPTDGRATLVEVTAQGRRLALRATDELNQAVFAALPMPERRVRTLVLALRDLRKGAGDLD